MPTLSTARYRVHGLVLQSSYALLNRRIDTSHRPDVRVRRGTTRQLGAAHGDLGPARNPGARFHWRQLASGATYLCWPGLFQFVVSPDGREILCGRFDGATKESFAVYLLSHVVSFSLLSLGFDPLHATAVMIDGAAVAFLGDSGLGKSTLGAALLASGYPLLADDLVVLTVRDGTWHVHPGVPRLKLFPSVLRNVLGPGHRSAPMNDGTSKVVVPLGDDQTAQREVPLKALYVLSEPASADDAIRITPLRGRAAFLELTRAAFNLLVLDRHRLENHFAFVARLTGSMPVRCLSYPRRLSALPAVCDALIDDLRRL